LTEVRECVQLSKKSLARDADSSRRKSRWLIVERKPKDVFNLSLQRRKGISTIHTNPREREP
jgi:hypothetical protein